MDRVLTSGSAQVVQQPLHRWEKCALGALFLGVILFGILVEVRSAYLESRKTDLGTYLRAAWAVRNGTDIYQVTDDNGWHYCYPPVFSVLMTPLADAPEGKPRNWMLPYPVSVGIWYAVNITAIFFALHWFAKAIEEMSPKSSAVGSRKWWRSRLIPFGVCLAPIGCTLSRGQVNMLVVALTAGMFLAFVRGWRFRSGLWLSAAICLKIFPVFLLIFPIRHRDVRSILGVGFGLLIGLVVIPASVWGLAGALDTNRRMVEAVILPGLGAGTDTTRDKELMELTATDNQSIQAVIHHFQIGGLSERPAHAGDPTKLAHVMLTALFTGLLLAAYGWKKNDSAIRNLLLLGGLIDIMAIASPVSHTHYFCLAMPLVLGLTQYSVSASDERHVPFLGTLVVCLLAGICFAVPMIPVWEGRREMGLSLFGSLILWLAAVIQLQRTKVSDCCNRACGTAISDAPARDPSSSFGSESSQRASEEPRLIIG